ncbi:hypothetical protein BJ684DRAFT_9889 [Piptocephalis cylindrospora]|uniref:histone deacetylase n=1 Tax=Piptocephalis cylindrospora TaxID=1907219 RepID=A0A4P9Y3Q7_9FUNG|nr:hypothetical protein BJ684DRAFT_9889 [Piptocephalis cylindrospora]|eukprot:RKP13557.1 hypothetical protein BJ684DRAFT_9889 [Piptocephalis cylindrospora]
MNKYELKTTESRFNSVYLCGQSAECARLSAGGVYAACAAVLRGDVRNAFAVVRPPGHHAEGFCLLNNVVIATRLCQKSFGIRRVLILDWDIHHGNGTQKAFYDDPNVLYISIHRWEEGEFYPSGDDGAPWAIGQGLGRGSNVNVAWSRAGMMDSDYLLAFQTVIMPIAREFDPELVIVSAGFDSAHGDHLGGCHVSPRGYARMLTSLMTLAQGKVVVTLEVR